MNTTDTNNKIFDNLNSGSYFLMCESDRRFIKVKQPKSYFGSKSVWYNDEYGNSNHFNAISLDDGQPIYIFWDTKVKEITDYNTLSQESAKNILRQYLNQSTSEQLRDEIEKREPTRCTTLLCGHYAMWKINSKVYKCNRCYFDWNQGTLLEPWDVDYAREKQVCRYCKYNSEAYVDNPLILNYGEEFAHKKCLENYKIKKVVDETKNSDNMVVTSDTTSDALLKNKHIETTKPMNTYNTLKEAVVASINSLKSNGTLSAYQITQHIRQATNDGLMEILGCVAKPNNANIKYWINHDDVRRIVNDMYASAELDALGFGSRNYNGNYLEYTFTSDSSSDTDDTNQTSVSTQTPTKVTTPPAVGLSVVESKVKNFLVEHYDENPTMKRIQSAIKIHGVTCNDLTNIVKGLGYHVEDRVDCVSNSFVD